MNPGDVARYKAGQQQQERQKAQRQLIAGRRRDARRNGYAGPLTRAENAALTEALTEPLTEPLTEALADT